MTSDWLIANLVKVIWDTSKTTTGMLNIGVYLVHEHVKPVHDCHLQDDKPARQEFVSLEKIFSVSPNLMVRAWVRKEFMIHRGKS